MVVPTLDTSRASSVYKEAFQRLRELPGFSQKQILLAEAGVILKTWAGRTKVGTVEAAERRLRARVAHQLKMQSAGGENPYGITVNNGARGGWRGEVWFRTKNKRFQQAGLINSGDNFKPTWTHWKDATWAQIQAGTAAYTTLLRSRRKAAKASVGLSRQSVIQIADQLQIDLSSVKGGGTLSNAGIAKARAAIASSGRAYQNGTGLLAGDEVRAYVDLISRLPYAQKIGMDRTLAGVVIGRAKYIETSYSKGAFTSMKKVAEAFPNLYVNESN